MIIAEVGLNHLGSISLAETYVTRLIETDIDGISFQIREKEYYLNSKKSHYSLHPYQYLKLVDMTKSAGKKFGIALADIEMIDFLESIDVDFYKVIRNDITNIELLTRLIDTGKKVIVSTGMSSDNDIETFMNIFGDNDNIVLNHTQLSHNIYDCNLSAIHELKEKYNCNVSYGNHCRNIDTVYMALCYNPSDILIYVKCDNMKYPDDQHAILLDEMLVVSKNLKELPVAIGKGKKQKMVNKIR